MEAIDIINKTKIKETNALLTYPDGTTVTPYKFICIDVIKEDGKRVYYTIRRSAHLFKDKHTHYIESRTVDGEGVLKVVTPRSKIYDDVVKFENAIKRISKLNIVKCRNI